MGRDVTVTNATLDALITNPDALARLPHLLGPLVAARKHRQGCAACGRAAANARLARAYTVTKRAMVGLSAEDKRAIKELIGADTVTISVARPGATRAADIRF